MFTGIVEAIGRIAASTPAGTGLRVRIDAGALELGETRIGDSIAVTGCCLTVVALAPPFVEFDVSVETLRCTRAFAEGAAVNLERALRLSDRLGGHLVSGHIDGVGRVVACEAFPVDSQGGRTIAVDLPEALARYVAAKGSIAIDGVSLTTNAIEGHRFTATLIAHTLAVTTLGTLRAGAEVNVEVDLLARYVERLRGGS